MWFGIVALVSLDLAIELEREDDGRWAAIEALPGVVAYGVQWA